MKKITLLIAFVLFAFGIFIPKTANSQFFNVYQIDDSEYPIIKGTYVAKDFVGNYFEDLTIDNFKVFENGVSYDETIDITCFNVDQEQPISVVLMMEASQGMGEIIGTGVSRMQWVVDASYKFIDSLKFGAPGALNIIQFASSLYNTSGWQTEFDPINTFLINTVLLPGPTDFTPPLDAAINALKARPSNMRRVIVCIFDGPASQNHDLDIVKMAEKCQEAEVEVYGVNLSLDSYSDYYDFQDFSNLTGGKTKVFFTEDKQGFEKELKVKAYEIQGYRDVCQISWETTQPCNLNDINRNVKIEFAKSTISDYARIDYTAPQPPMLEFTEDILFFAADQNYREINAEVTAKNEEVTINGIEFSKPGIFSASISTPYIIQKDNPFSFSVEYIEDPVTAPQIIEMSIVTAPCPTEKVIKLITNSSVDNSDEVDFGTVDIGQTTEKTFDCVLKNIMPVAISGNCQLIGAGISEMTILDGDGPFTLEPDECLDVKVEYARTSGGIIDVKLEYGLPLLFGSPLTIITMEETTIDVKETIASNGCYLSNNYPNPVENSTTIEYYLPTPQQVFINIYNIYGEKIAVLVDGSIQSGVNKIQWNASGLPSGLYLYELETSSATIQKRMIISK